MLVNLVEETCCSCHVSFWITAQHQKRLVETKERFHCPNGHGMSYLGKTDAQKLQELRSEKERIEREKNVEIDRLERQLRRKCRKPRTKKKP